MYLALKYTFSICSLGEYYLSLARERTMQWSPVNYFHWSSMIWINITLCPFNFKSKAVGKHVSSPSSPLKFKCLSWSLAISSCYYGHKEKLKWRRQIIIFMSKLFYLQIYLYYCSFTIKVWCTQLHVLFPHFFGQGLVYFPYFCIIL